MTIHKDLGVPFLDPFEQGGAEGDVRDKVAGVVRGRFVVVVMGVVVWVVCEVWGCRDRDRGTCVIPGYRL